MSLMGLEVVEEDEDTARRDGRQPDMSLIRA